MFKIRTSLIIDKTVRSRGYLVKKNSNGWCAFLRKDGTHKGLHLNYNNGALVYIHNMHMHSYDWLKARRDTIGKRISKLEGLKI